MNDFPTCLRHTTGNQFAYDTMTYAQGDTVVDLQGLMQVDVKNISAWVKLNKLTLNISKSGTMLVGTRQKLRGESELRISIDDEVLSDFYEAPCLGIILSRDLSWSNYILSYHKKWEFYVE